MSKQEGKRDLKILIVGYYGYSNSGDEAILSSICHDINQLARKADITVLSHNPESTIKEYGVAAYNRFNLFNVIKVIKSTDIVLMGGGSLLQDGTSSRSLYYYLFILKLASLFKKKIMLYANGIGPITKVFNRKSTARIVNKVDMITLREALSLEQLQLLGINKPAIHVTADPVFNMEINTVDISVLKDKYQLGVRQDSRGIPRQDKRIITVMIRSWKDTSRYINKIAHICDYIVREYHFEIVFVPMKYPVDLKISKIAQNLMAEKSIVIEDKLDANEILALIHDSVLVLSMRLHALIYAALGGIPMIGFEYDPKVSYYMNALNMPLAGKVLELDEAAVIECVEEVLRNLDDYSKKVAITSREMSEKARLNRQLLEELISKL